VSTAESFWGIFIFSVVRHDEQGTDQRHHNAETLEASNRLQTRGLGHDDQ
jgi:hypothetical protein